ncbi:TPA: DUF229 domain-containing protein [Candidatus Poribacteria bacterium]|nr:DUF229 domain-containing protein [Candidatus Poribacteria bacterium]HIA69945.1 DUF229 domain-containing protein [Candidatus Poribacteria bacterium]HIB87772.1 DUF229 domain-containing protein [Candidatus Poribacteria bacterium]HIC03615.1 DUF229 domain-containing protein [Candidatus Poribacteria bacterium]HIM10703.1 DUF229 domain-containing protein [Candidatus Poribacteria bacterium]
MDKKTNIVIIMTDQQRADVSAREGFPLDTTPFLDHLARQGTWFHRAYTSMPACAPARVSMLTGRYPSATQVRTNHNIADAFYDQDLFDVMHQHGYATALCGKNHSHLTANRVNYWLHLGHGGGSSQNRTEEEKAFDQYLQDLNHRAAFTPTPFPLECQCPYRAVSAAQQWIDTLNAQPFFLWLSFPEPHNPYQVPEPYFSAFPLESLPSTQSNAEHLESKGFKFQWTRHIGQLGFYDYEEQLPRARANYLGMLRMIDDQVKRLVEFLQDKGLLENTLLVFLSDHGDFVGEYGLVRKGPELPEVLTRIPLFFYGPGIQAKVDPHPAHVSIVDIFPTLCQMIGVGLPDGVQGRSLWSLLTGADYPKSEFESVYAEHGFGGLHYTADESLDPEQDGLQKGVRFDCLNSWTQSGTMRMIRRGDWKLIFDMQGNGQLYHLSEDPVELNNLYNRPQYATIQQELLAELLAAELRAQDPLPLPRRRYRIKTDESNYWTPYRHSKG